MIAHLECKNSESIKEKILSIIDKNRFKIDVSVLTLKELIDELSDKIDNLDEILKNCNISYIIYMEYTDGGFNFYSNDFNFQMTKGEDAFYYYSELAKMYKILANKNDVNLFINLYC